MAHPWHDIPLGDDAPEEVRAVIEVPRGDTTKYELDPELGVLNVNRILHPPIPYPANYGFLPQTLDDDGDPIDVLVMMQNPVVSLSVLRVRPIGVFKMKDEGETDDKLICVHVDDPMYSDYEEVEDLPRYERDELKWFFNSYKDAMQKGVDVEDFEGKEAARESIERCRKLYREKFGEK